MYVAHHFEFGMNSNANNFLERLCGNSYDWTRRRGHDMNSSTHLELTICTVCLKPLRSYNVLIIYLQLSMPHANI